MVHLIGEKKVRRSMLMNKKEQVDFEHIEFCFDQVSQEYTKVYDENQKLKIYVELLQTLCSQNGINYPPLEEPIKF